MNSLGHRFRRLVLPYPEDGPSSGAQHLSYHYVPLTVTVDFLMPVPAGVGRHPAMLRAAVPEAAVNKNRQLVTSEDDIRPDRALRQYDSVADSVAQSSTKELPAECQLRLCVGTLVGLHGTRGR